MPAHDLHLRSLMVATDIDVLPETAVVEEREGYVVVRTPSNPTYYWGNFLVYREPPVAGDRARWEADFEREIAVKQPGSVHRTFTWDRPDEVEGAARAEFAAAGYELDRDSALTAAPDELRAHARASRDVEVCALDPRDGADEDAWQQVLELQLAAREPGHAEADHRDFLAARMRDRRVRFVAGEGAWYGAWLDGELTASLGIVVTNGRARFQAVDTAQPFRRRGIASRLIVDAARDAVHRFGAERFVIVADADYHALGLYESLGFVRRETCIAVAWWPGAPNAALHPSLRPAG